MSRETVGSLLASIANSIQDGLRKLMFADKRGWGPDEFEQVRALEEVLDEAKRDFQELSRLVNGQVYYENDRRIESLQELRTLSSKFEFHAQNFKDWLRMGGPINPLWSRETKELRIELHRAQCRAAGRIYSAEQERNGRCLGAFQVYRRQRQLENAERKSRDGAGTRPIRHVRRQDSGDPAMGLTNGTDGDAKPDIPRRKSLEQLVPVCNAIGSFTRLGDRDIAFVCDYCDGHIVWEDLRAMPSTRAIPTSPEEGAYPNWQATAKSMSKDEDKTVVFAPLVVANHIAPEGGSWEARIWCPFCDDYTYYDQADDEQTKYAQDEDGFSDLQSFQEHLQWYHTAIPLPGLTAPREAAENNCILM